MKRLLLIGFLIVLVLPCEADNILKGMDFTRGRWAMVGVPIHNYKLMPIQEEMKTFISYDHVLMANLQQNWNFPVTYDDHCDFHYALKFYQNNVLIRTYEINLYCKYISLEGLSYEFPPEQLEQFRVQATTIPWSRISFSDMQMLQRAIFTLEKNPDVYWYEDVNPYKYPGFIMIGVDKLPWNANLDSLRTSLSGWVSQQTGRSEFYLTEHFHYFQNEQLYVRYLVHCHESLSWKLPPGTFLPWRSHLFNQDSVVIVALGIDRDKYKRLMNY